MWMRADHPVSPTFCMGAALGRVAVNQRPPVPTMSPVCGPLQRHVSRTVPHVLILSGVSGVWVPIKHVSEKN